MSTDVDLARLLHDQHGLNHCPHWVGGSVCERWAKFILASDWLATHTRAAVEQERERIAQAIYADRTPADPVGIQPWQHRAARIARADRIGGTQ